ncbi:LPP20 family lipoprotein [Vibrio algarum]|uniref:LPP20 family lipoprotein n=1 Tax=Vibrio algarum TaxID=3020714 RepID=A0ABT4YRL3_9VIBR|nr:LPP20 family lipoprotein [Vibrio sp. KJ40-1]MDB1124190.1 LPP20 family lipoprotein [Vibrio sp. KJ40-1]
MNTYKKIKYVLLTLCILLITACQSTSKPEWYETPKSDTSEYIYSVGEGRNLSHAKKTAANQINERLWTQVESSFYMRETASETNRSQNHQTFVDNKINTKTANLTLNGIEYLQQDQNDIGFYVEARIKKSTIRKQLKEELRQLNLAARRELEALKSSDSFLWWLNNKDVDERKEQALVRVGMLSVVDEHNVYSTDDISSLQEKVALVKSQLLVHLKVKFQDKKMALLMSEKLSSQQIASTFTSNRNTTHRLTLTTERRKNKVGDAFITTLITDVVMRNTKNKTVASNEIISSGNSVTSYKMSSEGAIRHFSEQVETQGLWESIGFN